MGSQIIHQKPHAVLVPHPTQGHVNPLMKLAKLLHSRGFHITFVNTEFNHRRLIRSKGLDSVKGFQDFRFETIPDGLPTSDSTIRDDVSKLCDSTRKNCFLHFKKLLDKLMIISSSLDGGDHDHDHDRVPPVSCVISDGTMSCGIKAAEEFGVPELHFWTASVCSFIGYLHHRELKKREIVPFKSK